MPLVLTANSLHLGLHVYRYGNPAQRNKGIQILPPTPTPTHISFSPRLVGARPSVVRRRKSFRFPASECLYLMSEKCEHFPQACTQDTAPSAAGHGVWPMVFHRGMGEGTLEVKCWEITSHMLVARVDRPNPTGHLA